VPATALRCRICEKQYPLDPVGVCASCFGPLEPVYDRDEQRRTVSRESIAAGPASIWRYAPLLPVAAPAEQRLPAGLTPLVSAPRLAAAVGVGPVGTQQLVVVVETTLGERPGVASTGLTKLVRDAVSMAPAAVLVIKSLPVDIRHNSKIDRVRVAAWAERVLAGSRAGRP